MVRAVGYSKQVEDQGQRPLPLDRLVMPMASARDRIEPFEGAVVMPYNLRDPEDKGNYLEAVKVLATCDDGDRVFVKFHRTGNTAWVDTDRLKDQR